MPPVAAAHNLELPPGPFLVDEGMPDAWAVPWIGGTDIIGADHAPVVTMDL